MAGAGRFNMRERLPAARNLARRAGATAAALFFFPLAVAAALLLVLALVRGPHHLGSAFVLAVAAIAVALSVGLPGVWFSSVDHRNGSKIG